MSKDVDPILEVVDEKPEADRFYSVIDDYDKWTDIITGHMVDMDRVLPGSSHTVVFLECFKDCSHYLTHPVGLFQFWSVAAKSRLVEDDQEVIDFITENTNIIPYMYFHDGNRKVFRYADKPERTHE